MMVPALPSVELLRMQAEWLAPARARLLRRAGVARRRRILDLGAGYGAVTGELARRGGGFVAALDMVETAVCQAPGLPVCGNGLSLPFADNSFDLIFAQCVLLWVGDGLKTATSAGSVQAVAEIHRVLAPNGVLIALEPDYAGMIEYPPEIATRDIWLAVLRRVGAEPRIGRLLPGMLAERGFQVRIDLLDSLAPPSPMRFDFLRTLPLTPAEADALEQAEISAARLGEEWRQIVHLPFFLISAYLP